MNKSTRSLVGVGSAIGTLLLSGILFTNIAAAADPSVVTGYETGYSYHQGLATGAGSELMAGSAQTPVSDMAVVSPSAGTAFTSGSAAQTAAPAPVPAPTSETTYVAPADNTAAPAAPLLDRILAANFSPAAVIVAALMVALILLVAMIADAFSRPRVEQRRTYAHY